MTATTTATSTVASTHAHSRQSRSRRASPEPSARLADRRTQSRTAAVVIAAVSAAPARIWSQSRNVTGGFGVIPTSSTPSSATRNWTTSPHVVPAVRSGAGSPACALRRAGSPRRALCPARPGSRLGPDAGSRADATSRGGAPSSPPGHPPVRVTTPPCVVTHRTRTDPQARCPGGASGPVSAAGDPPTAWSRAAADEDRRAGEQRAAQRRPLAPHGLAALRPLGLDEVVEHQPGGDDVADPVAQRAVVLDVGRRRPRRPPRRRACGRSTTGATVSPSGPGSSENIQRIGWFTANTQRPPGRSTRATSRITRSGSATNGTAPNAEQARSNGAVARTAAARRRPARAAQRRRSPRCSAAACRSIPPERSSATGRAPWVAQPARARRRARSRPRARGARRRRRAGARRLSRSPSGHQTKSTSPMSAPCSAR